MNKGSSQTLYLIVKRLFDILIGIIGLILVVPIAVVVKLCYVLTGDFNSIFYSQTRIGKDGQKIKIYKFRSMVPNADKKLEEILKENPKMKEEWDKYQKLSDDPRITKIGKILRKISIDETPQFLCLVTGKMSLVGPRPLVPGEIEQHKGNKKQYESVKPGITGWWAVNGRSAKSYKDRLELEYYYTKHRSLLLDIEIILRTFLILRTHEGAK